MTEREETPQPVVITEGFDGHVVLEAKDLAVGHTAVLVSLTPDRTADTKRPIWRTVLYLTRSEARELKLDLDTKRWQLIDLPGGIDTLLDKLTDVVGSSPGTLTDAPLKEGHRPPHPPPPEGPPGKVVTIKQ